MSGPITPILSNFNQADGPPNNFVQALNLYSVPDVISNALSWPEFPSAAWNAKFDPDQEAFARIATVVGTGFYLLLRFNNLNSGVETGYAIAGSNLAGGGDSACSVDKWVAGASSNLFFSNGAVPDGYNYAWATIIGNVITAYASPDGIAWTQVGQVTDSSSPLMSAGYIGLHHPNNGTAGTLEDFGGGTIRRPQYTQISTKEASRRSTRW